MGAHFVVERWLLLLVIGFVAVLPWVVIVTELPAVRSWRARRRAHGAGGR